MWSTCYLSIEQKPAVYASTTDAELTQYYISVMSIEPRQYLKEKNASFSLRLGFEKWVENVYIQYIICKI